MTLEENDLDEAASVERTRRESRERERKRGPLTTGPDI